jgi:hypothetical protein
VHDGVVPGIAPAARVPAFGRPRRRAERFLEAAYPARPTVAAPPVDDVVDVDVLWEAFDVAAEFDGAAEPWELASPFTYGATPTDLVRGYGARPRPTSGRLLDVRA